jgi:hypothetical protein
MNFKNKG